MGHPKGVVHSFEKIVPSGSGGSAKPYKYEQVMSFLDDTTEPRQSRTVGGGTEEPTNEEERDVHQTHTENEGEK